MRIRYPASGITSSPDFPGGGVNRADLYQLANTVKELKHRVIKAANAGDRAALKVLRPRLNEARRALKALKNQARAAP